MVRIGSPSSSQIDPVADSRPSASAALIGADRFTARVSSGSWGSSCRVATVTVCVVAPASKVSLPDANT